MYYRINPKNGDKISNLAYGCMRFPRKGGGIDQTYANSLVKEAIDSGMNLFDTAYIYPGSENALGTALDACGRRKDVFISTKLPPYLCKKTEDFEKIFTTQLSRLKTDYIDYYFLHMLTDVKSWEQLKSIGILDWISRKKESGAIRNIGFSFHGGVNAFREIVNAHDWDFCMIQYNYLDENNQAGYSGLRYANEKGLPVFIMEPLRGGTLATKLPPEAMKIFQAADVGKSFAEWGLRFVWNHPEVTSVLSGMSDIDQLRENIRIADTALPGSLTDTEKDVYKTVVAAINKVVKVPCTGCGYCIAVDDKQTGCPKSVDIPTCFSCYNESFSMGKKGRWQYYQYTGMISPTQTDASKCIGCHKCESHCPQNIQIAEELKNVRKRMNSGFMDFMLRVVRKIMRVNSASPPK
ncbi:aldo/keto reductase [Clostridia bacterium]|nr:aldo/keto reductase [Clostridia bacterium]